MSWSQHEEVVRSAAAAKRRSHRIRAFSSGWNFPPAKQGITNQFEGALIDDMWCRGGRNGGLRVISIPADDGEILLDNFSLLESDEAIARFTKLISTAEINTTLVLSCKQNLGRLPGRESRDGPERFAARVERAGFLLRGMGVRSNPEDEDHLSFVYIGVRRPQGFVRLAEKMSLTRGVSVAINLNEDVSVYDGYQAQTVIDNRWLLALKPELAKGERLEPESGRRFLKEVGYANLRTSLEQGQEARVRWELDEVAAATIAPGTKDKPFIRENIDANGSVSFSTKLAWRFTPGEQPAALQFTLRVNGRRMGDRVILKGLAESDRWLLWEEMLAADSGPIESLEIEVKRLGEGGAEAIVHLAETQLSAGELYSF